MAKTRKSDFDGILVVNKPYGVSSMAVVRRVKRASGQRRVGHAGTLDPIATGVLPVCIGQATRLMEDIVSGGKIYRAGVEFGVATDTYDALGEITASADPSAVTLDAISRALERFKGGIMQTPPMFSALKRQGKRLYDLARAGVEVEREPRPVKVHGIAVQSWQPPMLTIDISCGKGFYVRSLAHDLGQALGCPAHMKSLIRLRSGAFAIADSMTIDEVEDAFASGDWRCAVHAPDAALQGMRAAIVGSRAEDMLRNGRAIDAAPLDPMPHDGERVRAYSADGRFIAALSFDAATRRFRPDKVFALRYPQPIETA